MALLLQCLRDVRTRSGDLDLLPASARGDSVGADRRLRIDDDAGVVSSRFDVDEASGGRDGAAAKPAVPDIA
jgi:hypothetical protein